jgi:hypothetical protein
MSTAAAAEEDEEEEENAVARDGGFERADPSKKPPAVLNKDFIMKEPCIALKREPPNTPATPNM